MPDNPARYASRALTIAAELDGDGKLGKLRETLALIDGDIDGKNQDRPYPTQVNGANARNQIFRPGELPDTHFMRFLIVEDSQKSLKTLPTLLVWECNHDGRPEHYLRKVQEAAQRLGAMLDFDAVFAACKQYPGIKSGAKWVTWMLRRSIRAEAFYCGYRGIPKTRVDAAGRVHRAIRGILDTSRAELTGKTPAQVQGYIRGRLLATPPPEPLLDGDLAAASDPHPIFRRQKLTLYVLGILLAILFFPVVLVVGLIAWFIGLPYLEYREKRDKPGDDLDRAVHAAPDLIAVEDRIVQNQLTHIVDLKPGLFRYVLLRVVLLVINQLARVHYVNGHLGHITSIHFGRWVLLPDPRWWRLWWRRRDRLIFFSNYDFSWDSYLGEFVDRQATGLTGVWSNTEGFPRTRRLIHDGATDEERFKQWARSHQIKTQVWWSGVRHYGVANVNNAIAVHRGAVSRDLAPIDVERWVRLL